MILFIWILICIIIGKSNMLFTAHRRAERLGRNLVLRHPRPAVGRVLAMTKLSRVLHIVRV